jgi:hypothetical protein
MPLKRLPDMPAKEPTGRINICQLVVIIHDSEQKNVSLLKIIKFDSRPNHTTLSAITSKHCSEDAAV